MTESLDEERIARNYARLFYDKYFIIFSHENPRRWCVCHYEPDAIAFTVDERFHTEDEANANRLRMNVDAVINAYIKALPMESGEARTVDA